MAAVTGLKITLPVAFTDLTLPIVQDDAILTSGSLLLLDAGHSLGGFGVGVPANAALLPNVAWKQAAAVLGSGSASSLSGVVARAGGAGSVLAERSTKGGLHVIVSNVAHVLGDGIAISAPAAIVSYLYNNPAHASYVSIWQRVTRTGTVGVVERHNYIGDKTLVTSYRSQFYSIGAATGTYPSAGTSPASYTGAHASVTETAGGGLFQALGTSPAVGAALTAPNYVANMAIHGWTGAEATLAATPGADLQKVSSRITYRMYLEDLTVSGRTYAQVDAIDFAKYTTDVVNAGGRFNGDTYTAPSTLP